MIYKQQKATQSFCNGRVYEADVKILFHKVLINLYIQLSKFIIVISNNLMKLEKKNL